MRKLYISFSAILICSFAQAQDPEFTQFYANPAYLNPAFAGASNCPRMIMNYRNQWPGLSGTFVTYAASYDAHIDKLAGGIGLRVMQDNQAGGTLNTTSVSGMYAYHMNVNRYFSVRAGFEATYFNKSLNWSKLNFSDQIDNRYGFIYQSKEIPGGNAVGMPDFSAGLLGYSKLFYAGVAVHHLTKPQEGFKESPAQLPRKFTAHMGANIPVDRRNPKQGAVSPNILFQQQQDHQQLNIGIYATKGPMVGGLWYRNQDSFILLVGLQSDLVKIGYSYDITISKLSNATYGSHELSFALQFNCREKPRKFRATGCPSF